MHYLLHYQQPFYSNARDLSEFSKAWCCQSTPGATPSSVVSFPACSVFSQGSQQMVELNILPPDLSGETLLSGNGFFQVLAYHKSFFHPNVSVSSMGQHLGKREAPTDSKGSFRGALSPAPQKAAAAPRKRGPENAVVSFFRTIVSPAPPKSRWRGLVAKMGLGDQKSQSAKAKKASAGDGKGTLTRIFKMGSRSASPVKR
ncbi:Myelin basic protein [Dissostichus eleginoides]|uniref:Myelin basic protein n=1 Tax=Dissostichus eleginoides TaxID=100907 RepID=A0AAD9FEA0_DISEL|nr:Myelin basic protein [Dissostichus eleginoides]